MSPTHRGVWLAVLAFSLWGAYPFYFKLLTHINPLAVLANRVIWSAVLLCLIIALLHYGHRVRSAWRDKEQRYYLALATVLIATNWGTYIWSVVSNRLFEASLGYYINPLLNILLGSLLLGERLRPIQWLAVGLAALAVALKVISLGSIPWIAMTVAITFSFYGFIHKRLRTDSLSGLFVETLILLPVALLFLTALANQQSGPVVWSQSDWLLLLAAGPITVIPLLLFTEAAKRITYTTIGFLQYITPSILFLLATFYYREPFTLATLLTFIVIWLALLIISVDALRQHRASS